MPSGADLEYARLLRAAGVSSGQGLDGARLAQMVQEGSIASEVLASAKNISGAPTGLTTAGGPGANTDIPFCSIVVPPSSRPVVIEFGGTFTTTVVGMGSILLSLMETTAGSVQTDTATMGIPQSATFGANFVSLHRSFELGPTIVQRTFKLSALLWTNVGDDAAGEFINATTHASYVRAVAQ